MKPVSVTIRWSDGSLTHDIYDGESYYRNPAAMADRPVALHGINRWSSILAFGLKGTFMVGKLFTTLMVQLLPTGATRRNKPRLVESRGTSVCATGIYEQLTPEQRERAKNVVLHDWEWDADLMRCTHCQKALHITHAGHGLNHSSSCRNGEQYPWERLHACYTPEKREIER
jgi:hypothetical protein